MTTTHDQQKQVYYTNNNNQLDVGELRCTQLLVEENNIFTGWGNTSLTPTTYVSQVMDVTNRVVADNFADNWNRITLTPGIDGSVDARLVSSSIVGTEFVAMDLLRIKNSQNSNDGVFEVVSSGAGFVAVAGQLTAMAEVYTKPNFNYEVLNKTDGTDPTLIIDKIAVSNLIEILTDEINVLIDLAINNFVTNDLENLVQPLIDASITNFVNNDLENLVQPLIDQSITDFVNNDLDALVDARIALYFANNFANEFAQEYVATLPRVALISTSEPSPVQSVTLTNVLQTIVTTSYSDTFIDRFDTFTNYDMLTEVSFYADTTNNTGPLVQCALLPDVPGSFTGLRDFTVHQDQGDPNNDVMTARFLYTYTFGGPNSSISFLARTDVANDVDILWGKSLVPAITDPPPIVIKHTILAAT